MKAELIQEFQMMQESRANKFSGDLADKILSSVDAVKDRVTHSVAQRGKMLMLLENKLNLTTFRNLRKRFLKF